MDSPAANSSVLTNDIPTVASTPPLTTIVENTDDSQTIPVHHSRPTTHNLLIPIFFIAFTTFGLGLAGTVGYYRYFNDSIPLPPTNTNGMLLGLSDTAVTPVPSASPTPDLSLKPETVDDPLPGTLGYVQDNQIVTQKADRTSPDTLTSDDTIKSELVASPTGNSLAYIFQNPEESATGLALVTRSNKTTKVLVEAEKFVYTKPQFSDSGNFLSLWVNQGLEAIVVDIAAAKITARFSTPDPSGISPMVWLKGQDRVSFILKNELFSANSQGGNLISHALDVVGVSPVADNTQEALGPIWSADNRYVAFIRTTGIYLLDTQSKQETQVTSVKTPYENSKIPWRLVAFTESNSHLIFQDSSVEDQQSLLTYSLSEKKTVALSDASMPILNASANAVIGLPPSNSQENTLEKYSLTTWKLETCSTSDFTYRKPTLLSPSALHPLISPDFQGIIGYAKDAKPITTVKLMNLNTCDTYDLTKAPSISSVVWLPN